MRIGAGRIAPPAVLAAAMVIAACGSTTPSHSDSTSASGNASSGSVSTQIHNESVSFSRCVRANGVPNFPDPPGNRAYGLKSFAQQSNGETLSINGVSVNAATGSVAGRPTSKVAWRAELLGPTGVYGGVSRAGTRARTVVGPAQASWLLVLDAARTHAGRCWLEVRLP